MSVNQWSNYRKLSVGAESVEAPKGVGSREGAVPPPEEKKFKFQYKMLQFGAFWWLLQAIFYSL